MVSSLTQNLLLKITFNTLKPPVLLALDILRVVGHTDLGADRIVLLPPCFFNSVKIPLTGIDYTAPKSVCQLYYCIVYGSARRSILKQLDPIHHQGLRIALGAFRISPIQSLYIEAHEPSLTTRRW